MSGSCIVSYQNRPRVDTVDVLRGVLIEPRSSRHPSLIWLDKIVAVGLSGSSGWLWEPGEWLVEFQ